MEGPDFSQEGSLLDKLYETRDRMENAPEADRLSLQLQIIDAHIIAGGQTDEVIVESLGDIRQAANRSGLTELVERVDAVGREHGFLIEK